MPAFLFVKYEKLSRLAGDTHLCLAVRKQYREPLSIEPFAFKCYKMESRQWSTSGQEQEYESFDSDPAASRRRAV